MKRKITEISTGSMADIAFLLLIFFLVSTTIEKDKGYLRQMPAKRKSSPKPETIHPKNIFEIKINNDNELWIENRTSSIKSLKNELTDFYLSNSPVGSSNTSQPQWSSFKEYSNYSSLNSNAFINLEAQKKTNYKSYMEIKSIIQETIHDCRNELSYYYFNVSYDYLLQHKESEYEKINVLKSILPLKIADHKIK